MPALKRFNNHLRSMLWKVSVKEEVDLELDFHVEMRTRELIARGMSPDRARRAALARLGPVGELKRECRRIANGRDRQLRFLDWWCDLKGDLAFALRLMRRNPLLSAAVALTLALGIAANTIVFSVANAVLLRPLPWPEPDQLVRINELTPNGDRFSISDPNFLDFRAQNHSFTDIGAIAFPAPQITLFGGGEPENLTAISCTSSYLRVLGITPALGRTFLEEEGSPGGKARAVVISHGLWTRRFGSDRSVVGGNLNLNGETWTIVGVMPHGSDFPFDADMFVPYAPDPGGNRADHRLEAFGRLKRGVSLDQAREDLGAIAARLSVAYPRSNKDWGVTMRSVKDWIVGPGVRRVVLVLQVAVAMMLLLACANVSALLLARATARRREIAIRTALGAGRSRIVRQLLTEAALLSLAGMGVGLALTEWALPVLIALNPQALPRWEEVSIDSTVLVFTLLVSIGAGLAAGLAPALHISRGRPPDALRESGGGAASGVRHLRGALVAGELALAMTLLIGAALLATSLYKLQNTDPGFEATNVLLAPINLPQNKYPVAAAFYRELLERIRAIPGVRAAGASIVNPYQGFRPANEVGDPEAHEQSEFVPVQWRTVTPGYFRAMHVPLLRGRYFQASDGRRQPSAPVIISDELARRLWPGKDPIGNHVRWNNPRGPEMEVVGVVTGIRDIEIQTTPEPMIFLPHEMTGWPSMTLFIKSSVPPGSVSAAVRKEVWAVDSALPAPALMPLTASLRTATAGPRLNTRLLLLFAGIALIVAAMGVYGVISFEVTGRTHEIGVRTALGATAPSVVRLMLSRGFLLIAIGMVLGVFGAMSLSRFIGSLLYETSSTNWLTYCAAAAVFTSAGTLAAWLPARRAARVDPVIALREE
jgi:putative ABC transport system permease protein